MVFAGQATGATHELDVLAQLPPATLHARVLAPVAPDGEPDVDVIDADSPMLAELPTEPLQVLAPAVHETELAGHPVTVMVVAPVATPAGYLFPAASTPAAYSALSPNEYDPLADGEPEARARLPKNIGTIPGGKALAAVVKLSATMLAPLDNAPMGAE